MVYSFFPKLENIYTLCDEREGILKFIGETNFANGIWYGFELIDSVGKHDGEVKGKRYFKTSNDPPRGVFVRRHKILAESEGESLRGDKIKTKYVGGEIQQKAQDPQKNWTPAKYEVPTDKEIHGRRERSDSQHYLTATGKKKKLGPREIGRIEGWKPAVYEPADTGNFLARRRQSFADGNHVITVEKKQQTDAQHYLTETGRKKKLGPREIGRMSSNWKPAKFETSDTGAFLARRRTSVTEYNIEKRQNKDTQHYVTDFGKKKKLGPRQIGRNKDWKPAEYNVPSSTEFLAKRRYLVPGTTSSKVDQRAQTDTQHYVSKTGKMRKLGPRDIGRIDNWKPANYDLSDTGAFLERRGSSFVGSKGSKHHVRSKSEAQQKITKPKKSEKLGSIDIGNYKSNWFAENYGISKTGWFLEKRQHLMVEGEQEEVESLEHTDAQNIIDKERLNSLDCKEIKSFNGLKPAKCDKFDKGKFLNERGSSFTAYAMDGGIIRKHDVETVERPAGWVPADYEDPGQEISDILPTQNYNKFEADSELSLYVE